jgi:hypothetical protein
LLDQPAASLRHRRRGAVGYVGEVGVGCVIGRQLGRVRVEPETDLAPALVDERRQPVGEWGRVSRP